jgi:hypothetical protein
MSNSEPGRVRRKRDSNPSIFNGSNFINIHMGL